MMRVGTLLVLLLAGSSLAPAAVAQEHGQISAYGDYFHLSQTDTNLAGLGGRFSLNVARPAQLEAEMNYDFEEAFTETLTDPISGSVTFNRSNLRLLHGLFGPKLQTTRGPLRAFLTVKGGAINFRVDPRPATAGTVISSIENLRANNVSGILYSGGGLEGHLGPVGLRLDVGDEIYFNSGAHHNLRVSVGPILRF
jgi:hypothetical protein